VEHVQGKMTDGLKVRVKRVRGACGANMSGAIRSMCVTGIQSGPTPKEVGSNTNADARADTRFHDRGSIPSLCYCSHVCQQLLHGVACREERARTNGTTTPPAPRAISEYLVILCCSRERSAANASSDARCT